MNNKKELKKYIEEHWELDKYETERAADRIDKMRCPLSMASPEVEQHLEDLVEEFCGENNLSEDWFYSVYDSYEDLFWECDI